VISVRGLVLVCKSLYVVWLRLVYVMVEVCDVAWWASIWHPGHCSGSAGSALSQLAPTAVIDG
jgi:hypothetical protein